MLCEKCKKSYSGETRFCKHCGVEIPAEVLRRKELRNILAIVLTGIFLIVFAVIFVFILREAGKGKIPAATKPQLPSSVKPDKNFPVAGRNYTVSGLHLKLIYVAPGTFNMGCNSGDIDEKPVHKVTISKGYWIGKYEITQQQYHFLMNENPSYFKDFEKPVECVSWRDAMEFCSGLNRIERHAGRLPRNYEYRLPTEAEWEYAARGYNSSSNGGSDFKYSGSNKLDEVGWYENNADGSTRKVGGKKPNALGIYDMSGNVWEWCLDSCNKSGLLPGVYTDTYKDGIVNPVNRSYFHIFRGGGWYSEASHCRVSKRTGTSCRRKLYYLGFRVVLAPVVLK
jgi:formylglycine-generating enzyme required for sulfatase activity